jgi:DNA-binding transcriptional regulator YiaG
MTPRRFSTLAAGKTLSPEDLREIGEALYGPWGWQTRLAETLEVDGSTVRRWVSGAIAAPHPVKLALRLLLEANGLYRSPPAEPPAPGKRPSKPRSGR